MSSMKMNKWVTVAFEECLRGSHHDIDDRKTLVTGPHVAANSKAPCCATVAKKAQTTTNQGMNSMITIGKYS